MRTIHKCTPCVQAASHLCLPFANVRFQDLFAKSIYAFFVFPFQPFSSSQLSCFLSGFTSHLNFLSIWFSNYKLFVSASFITIVQNANTNIPTPLEYNPYCKCKSTSTTCEGKIPPPSRIGLKQINIHAKKRLQ